MSILSTIDTKARQITVAETKTVRELLHELELSVDHVVLMDGKKMSLDDVIEENAVVVVLPLIAGG
ncbi:MAG: MoaD/ThiS family protein [Candidatus Thorarchaeota archaeon]|nr:MAG: MoaD/ThiS family protein [Candidatus Thorarchaeota archaeon]